jgi:alkylhydroperoxidase family enzyme
MRIPAWTPDAAPRDPDLLKAILERRGGAFINLDLALLWSEPLARGWNVYVGAVRRQLAVSPRLKELAICVVARLTGAGYEFTHHWPEYVKAGGDDALRARLDDPDRAMDDRAFGEDERLAMRYAAAMTRDIKVPEGLFREVRARFETRELVELTAAIATYNMVARFLVALEVSPEEAPAPGVR